MCNDRQHDIELEISGLPGHCRWSRRYRSTCAHSMATASGIYGIDLARHDAGAGLQGRQFAISPMPASGPEFIQRRSLAIFIRLTASVFS